MRTAEDCGSDDHRLACAVISTVIGLAVGIVSVSVGGWFDALVMRVVDGINAMPHLVIRGGSSPPCGAANRRHHRLHRAHPLAGRSPVVRAELLDNQNAGWIESARLAGASRWFIGTWHLLPAVIGQALVAMTMLLPHAVWHETTLSFLGVGLSPDEASPANTSVRPGDADRRMVDACRAGVALILAALAFSAAGSAIKRRSAPESEKW